MPKYNDRFELSVEDLDLIEGALRREKTALTTDAMNAETTGSPQHNEGEAAEDSARQIHELLGRLHNQKVFYRPESETYVSG